MPLNIPIMIGFGKLISVRYVRMGENPIGFFKSLNFVCYE